MSLFNRWKITERNFISKNINPPQRISSLLGPSGKADVTLRSNKDTSLEMLPELNRTPIRIKVSTLRREIKNTRCLLMTQVKRCGIRRSIRGDIHANVSYHKNVPPRNPIRIIGFGVKVTKPHCCRR